MACYAIKGQTANHLERMASAPTLSTSEDSLFPAPKMYDGLPSIPFRFSGTSSAQTITFDLNIVPNANMSAASTASVLTFWTVLTGSVVRSTADAYTGTYSMAVTASGSGGEAYQDVDIFAEEEANATVAVRGDGAAGCSAKVQNRRTKNWLTSTGGWQAAEVALLANATTSWAELTVEGVDVESMRACKGELRLTLETTSTSGTVYGGLFAVWPSVNFVSGHGHNVDDGVSLMLRRSSDAFVAVDTSEVEITPRQPTFYSVLTSQKTDRYWRLAFTGTNAEAIWLGEVVLGQAVSLTCLPLAPWSEESEDAQIRTGLGAYLQGDQPKRRLTLSFDLDSATKLGQNYDLYECSRGGAYPLVLVPMSTETACYYCRIDQVYKTSREHVSSWGVEMVFAEEPFPTFVT